ncbi:MAG TPA: energy-coupling factor transporter ATPase [Anaerolineae bacterium]|nr:energy-coupling factor transporter ATPase [Anaerolineae bacterium]HQI87227.1 energy-coupling factor transporter ATPase [Anaerolineae bacterium]
MQDNLQAFPTGSIYPLQTSLIEFTNVTYAYPLPNGGRIAALRDVSLRIEAGEYVAIVGANGSGKSTLARHLNALLVPDSGRVTVAGLDTRDQAQHATIHRTVGMVFQRPEDQIVASLVEEDVAFGAENMGLPSAEIRARVDEALATVGMADMRLRPPHQLSAGQQQRVALAGVLAMRPRCIVFDEATAMLDPAGRRAVREMMVNLHRAGLTIIAITHFMEEVLDAQRVVVLERGRVALDGSPEAVFADPDTLRTLGLDLPPAASLARTLRQRFPVLPTGLLTVPALVEALDALPHHAADLPVTQVEPVPVVGTPLIEVRDLGHTYMLGTPLAQRSLEGVRLSIAEGAAHGLLGATGSGKSTLMQHLNGLLRPQEGTVRVGEYALHDLQTDVRAVRRMVGLVFQLPETQIFEQYVGDEIAYGPRLQGLLGDSLRQRVRWAMELVGMGFNAFKDRFTFALSGGEKRKVALASILALRPSVLLLDEPTAGLDPASHRELLAHLCKLKETGMTLVLSSHQMEDVAALTDHVTVLDGGHSILNGRVTEVFAQGERLRALGLSTPVITQVVEGLRERGWVLPPGLVSSTALIEALSRTLSSTD